MKALVVAPQPFFSPRGTPFSVYYRTLVTTELGVQVDFLTYGEGQDVAIPGMRTIRIPRVPFLGDIKVGPSIPKLFLDVFMVVWAIGLLLRNRYDYVHAHEEAIFFCRFLKPVFRFKLVYDMHSSLPQQLTNFQFSKSQTLIDLFKRLEDTCLKAADAVITICPDLADYVTRLLLNGRKHTLIENSIFDPVRVVPDRASTKQERPGKGLGEDAVDLPRLKRLVVYAGTLEPYQGIDILIKAFSHVMARDPDAMLLIVGGNKNQVAHYSALAQSVGIQESCVFTGRVPQSLAKHYTQLATVLVSPRSEGTNTPLKVYEQLASGIPLVATRIYSHTQVLDDRVAFLVEPEPKDMARGILAALKLDGEGRHIAANAMRLYEEKYSRPVYVGKMKRLLETLS
jgi:glycosyltransferase involved in cell wall biosynthesis